MSFLGNISGTRNLILNLIFPVVGCIISNWRHCASIKILLKARRLQNLGSINPIPLAVAFISCVFWLIYGCLLGDFFYALSVCIGILSTFFATTTSMNLLGASGRHEALRSMEKILVPSFALCTFIFVLQTTHLLTFDWVLKIFSYLCVASSFLYGLSPLALIVKIIKEKDASSLHTPTVLLNMLSGTMWVGYGIGIKNWVGIIPSSWTLLSNSIQLTLKIFYRNKNDSGKKEEDNIVVDVANQFTGGNDSSGGIEMEMLRKSSLDDGAVAADIEEQRQRMSNSGSLVRDLAAPDITLFTRRQSDATLASENNDAALTMAAVAPRSRSQTLVDAITDVLLTAFKPELTPRDILQMESYCDDSSPFSSFHDEHETGSIRSNDFSNNNNNNNNNNNSSSHSNYSYNSSPDRIGTTNRRGLYNEGGGGKNNLLVTLSDMLATSFPSITTEIGDPSAFQDPLALSFCPVPDESLQQLQQQQQQQQQQQSFSSLQSHNNLNNHKSSISRSFNVTPHNFYDKMPVAWENNTSISSASNVTGASANLSGECLMEQQHEPLLPTIRMTNSRSRSNSGAITAPPIEGRRRGSSISTGILPPGIVRSISGGGLITRSRQGSAAVVPVPVPVPAPSLSSAAIAAAEEATTALLSQYPT